MRDRHKTITTHKKETPCIFFHEKYREFRLRTCGDQVAHAPSRRRAVCTGRLVTRDASCSASAARKAVRPVCFFPARLRRASRAAAPGNSRTGFVFLPSPARTRLILCCSPSRGSCEPEPCESFSRMRARFLSPGNAHCEKDRKTPPARGLEPKRFRPVPGEF